MYTLVINAAFPKIEVRAIPQASEKKLKEWNERAGDNLKTTLEKELSAVTLNILTANADKAIDAILKGKDDEVTVTNADQNGFVTIHPSAIYKTLVSTYGDSPSILKDKVAELVKYYAKPIARFADYVDKSAYSDK